MKRKIVFKKQKDFERNSYWKDTRDSSNQNQKRKNKKEEEWVSQFLRILKKNVWIQKGKLDWWIDWLALTIKNNSLASSYNDNNNNLILFDIKN